MLQGYGAVSLCQAPAAGFDPADGGLSGGGAGAACRDQENRAEIPVQGAAPRYEMPDDVTQTLSREGLQEAYDLRPAYQRNDYIG